MNLNCQKFSLIAIVKLSLLGLAGNVNAELLIEHGPSLRADTDYHSNIQFSPQGKQSVYLYRLIPTYNITAADGQNEWFGDVGLTAERSSNTTVSKNREDPFGEIGWKRLLENGTVGVLAAYRRDTTRNTQFTETGIFTQDGTSVTRFLTGDWQRSINDKLDFALQGHYEKIKFSGAPGLSNYEHRYVTTDWFYKLSEKIRPFARFGLNDFRTDAEINSKIKYQEYLLGAIYNVSPNFTVSAAGGATHISSADSDSDINNRNEGSGIVRGEYSGAKHTLTGVLSRSIEPAAGGSIQLEDLLGVGFLYNLSEKSLIGTDLAFTQNRANGNELHTQDVLGYYRRELTASWMVELSAAFRNQKIESTPSTNDNVISIGFTYQTDKPAVQPRSPF